MSNRLEMWVVYDHPLDFPNSVVARRWVINFKGKEEATEMRVVGPDLEAVRSILANLGLTPLGRDISDDPKIVETWV